MDLAARLKQSEEEMRDWQEYFTWGQESGGANYFPINFEYLDLGDREIAPGFALQRIEWLTEPFDLKLGCQEIDGRLGVHLSYNASSVEPLTGRLYAERIGKLIESLCERPEATVGELEMVGDYERRLIKGFNQEGAEYQGPWLHQEIERQAELRPESVAVVSEEGELSYGELNARANRLARRLRRKGVVGESLVGILMDRSCEMVIGMLGTLKAGGAYVPLEPSHPVERLKYVVEDAGIRLILTEERSKSELCEEVEETLCLDSGWGEVSEERAENPVSEVSGENAAYCLYTSGTSGRPKGAVIPHRAIGNHMEWMNEKFGMDEKDRVFQKTPFGFDASVWEFYAPLMSGGRLILARSGGHRESGYLAETMIREGVTIAQMTPTMLRLVVREEGMRKCQSLRKMFCGGEELGEELAREFYEVNGRAELHNLYGPTETCIDATEYEVKREEKGRVAIGRGIRNVEIYVLDERKRETGIGMVGEVHIGGECLGRGYVGNAVMTAEKFAPDGSGVREGRRLYASGDRGRYRSDGEIEYVGRVDRQVKLRGYRIELGEIEEVIRGLEGVREAAVVIREAEGEERLVGYVESEEGREVSEEDVRSRLRERLPEYMRPARLVKMEKLPQTPSGKIDRRALPEMGTEMRGRDVEMTAPRTAVEEIVAGMWSRVLGIERVGLDENFFDLGGHSMLATLLMAKVQETFGIEMALREIFENPTVAGLSETIEAALQSGRKSRAPSIEKASRSEPLPLSFAQQRLWLLDQLNPGEGAYNMNISLRLKGSLNKFVFERSLNELIKRHEILRTRFESPDGIPIQAVDPALEINLQERDLRDLPEAEREAKALRLTNGEAQRPFDLARGPLIRAMLLRLGEQEYVQLVTLHHILSDGLSNQILARELTAIYEAFSKGLPSPLPELSLQYADYAVWQRNWLQGEALDEELAFWKRYLGTTPPDMKLPTDHQRPTRPTFNGATKSFALSPDLTVQLRSLSRSKSSTLYMTMLGAFAALLSRYTNKEQLLIGSPITGRNRPELEELVGFFVNTVVFRADLSGNPSFHQLLDRTREAALELYAHKELPFEKLVEALQPERDLNSNPLFQVMFAFGDMSKTHEVNLEFTTSNFGGGNDGAILDLILTVIDTGEGLICNLNYNTDLFEADSIVTLAGNYQSLLEAMVANPETLVREVSLSIPDRGSDPPEEPARTNERKDAISGESTRRARVNARKSRLSPDKQAMLRNRLRGESSGKQASDLIPKRPLEEPAPLSFAQQRLWFLDQLEPGSPLYNITSAFRYRGELDAQALARSVNEIIRRHESLRATFVMNGKAPYQRVTPELALTIPSTDLCDLSEAEQEAEVQRCIAAEARKPFDLSTGPLLRLHLLRLGQGKHVILMTIHHIVSDGRSMDVLAGELTTLYRAYTQGNESPLPELTVQYTDYAHWQRRWLQGETLNEQLAYWKHQLRGELPTLDFPTDRPRPDRQTVAGDCRFFAAAPALTAQLKALSAQEGVTLFTTLLATLAALIHRYTGQADIIIGSPVAGRNRPELEPLIGFFVNTLALRLDLTGDPDARALIGRAHETVIGAQANQDIPFEKIIEELRLQRDPGRTPLFQILLAYQQGLRRQGGHFDSEITPLPSHSGTAKFDLTFGLTDDGQAISGGVEYNKALFDEATIDRLIRHLLNLSSSMAQSPDLPISRLSLLGEEEELEITRNCDPAKVYEAPGCLHEWFAGQAAATPDAIALCDAAHQLSYAELDAQANQVGNYLRSHGARAGEVVGIVMERRVELVIAILGTLKSGAAYLPLDPAHPVERLRWMLDDAGTRLVISDGPQALALAGAGATALCLDQDLEQIIQQSRERPQGESDAGHVAYIIYTSGSTGKPKGVMAPHSAVTRLMRAAESHMEFDSGDVWTLFHSHAFDFSVWEMWGALLYGGRLVVVSYEVSRSPEKFLRLLVEERVTALNQTPSAFNQLISAEARLGSSGLALRYVIFGGEALEPKKLKSWVVRQGDESPRLINMYGITETTVHVTSRRISRADVSGGAGSVIGQPLGDLQVYVLDQGRQVAPVGVFGELYVGGAGVTIGYWGRPELTAERFVPDPFSREPGQRLYRSGDRGRYLANWELEYAGRVDEQVKLRGFRIELGEIEAVLSDCPGVSEAAVRLHGKEENARLVGYLAPQEGAEVDTQRLRQYLKERLPEYMVPKAFVIMERLPLTPNGKLDRRALPPPDESRLEEEKEYIAPRTLTEEMVARIMANTLEIERVGLFDDFFDLGGHSLLATQLVAHIRDVFSVEVELRQLFESATVEMISGYIEDAQRENHGVKTPPLVAVPRDGNLPLSFAQRRLWFLDRLHPGMATYNIPTAIVLDGPLDVKALGDSLSEIVRRHEALRVTFALVDGEPVQLFSEPAAANWSLVDLSEKPEPERRSEAQRIVAEEAAEPFDLARGPLYRTRLLRLGPEEHVALLTMHHIISDGWSLRIFSDELRTLYEASVKGESASLAPLAIQYADYAVWQREWMQGEILEAELSYWRKQLAGSPPMLDMPTDHPRPIEQSFRGGSRTILLDEDVTEWLRRFSREHTATLYMTLLAAFKALLYRCTGQRDIVIGTPIAGRNFVELEKLIGFFVNTLALRSDLSGDPTFRQFLMSVREVALDAYAHSHIPFDKLVEELHPGRDLGRTPLFNVMFVLQNFPRAPLDLPDLGARGASEGAGLIQFDLLMMATETGQRLSCSLAYNADLFNGSTIKRLLARFENLLRTLAENPDQRLSEIRLMDDTETKGVKPEDFSDIDLSHEEFENLLAEISHNSACIELQ
jgi:amino acid adenylation domain-containing protein